MAKENLKALDLVVTQIQNGMLFPQNYSELGDFLKCVWSDS